MAKRDEAIRITTASSSLEDDIRTRQRRYLTAMLIRVVCFAGAVIAGVAGLHWLWPVLILLALVLPYIAVVMANAAHTKGDGFTLMDSPYGRPQLPPGRHE